jgi:hypothetical protein
MGKHVIPVEKTTVYGIGIAVAVVFESGFAEVGSKGTVWEPTSCVVKLL